MPIRTQNYYLSQNNSLLLIHALDKNAVNGKFIWLIYKNNMIIYDCLNPDFEDHIINFLEIFIKMKFICK